MKTIAVALTLVPLLASAQGTKASKSHALPEAQQLASAVLPLPQQFREGATVLGYRDGAAKLTALKKGSGDFTCLAANPEGTSFHLACYHNSLEPFMARGRELRAQGVTGDRVDTVRFAEIKSGKLAMPKQPAALYQLTGPLGSYDAATNTVKGAQPLYVIYINGATGATTGLSEKPVPNGPWIMYPGTPKAHIMLSPKM
jgi:hypothetical protein